MHGLHDWQILIMSVFFNEAIALPVSENCCHGTSVSNVYIAAWQEIVKPAKVIELSYVCFTAYPFNYSLCRNRMVRSARVYA